MNASCGEKSASRNCGRFTEAGERKEHKEKLEAEDWRSFESLRR